MVVGVVELEPSRSGKGSMEMNTMQKFDVLLSSRNMKVTASACQCPSLPFTPIAYGLKPHSPIMTYSGQGVKKRGVHASHHTIIYTDKPIISKGEKEKGLTKKPIKIIPSSPRHKLDRYSRLNYAKTYTVEYNVKVCKYPRPGIPMFFHLMIKGHLRIHLLTPERVHRKS